MKKILLVPDSFKGTMSSGEICGIMREVIHKLSPGTETVSIPVADGGEGGVDCFLHAVGGDKKFVSVQGVFGEIMEGFYGLLADHCTAVIEMAACAGLPLAEGHPDPERATTYGVGELLLAASRQGVKRIIVGLGGSATNDGGCGAAAAAGVRFYDAEGKDFIPVGGTLGEIRHIDVSGLDATLREVEIIAMCDIDNSMYGEKGAAYIFGPQKGADEKMVRRLDMGLRHLADVMQRDLGADYSTLPGGGAAGAMGAGMAAFFQAKLQMGIDTVLDTVGFDRLLQGAQLVMTGEGKIDFQSLGGKVVIGVARRVKKRNVPVIAVVGAIGEGFEGAYAEGVTSIFSINREPMDFERSRHHSKANLAVAVENIMRLALRLDT